ncbi:Sxm1 [Kluyveromyces lactis]|nr:Sxm1 [Kluyveromyces lactis]
MVNEQLTLQLFSQTMTSDARSIKAAEQQLFELQKEPGFLSFLLNTTNNTQLEIPIRMSCAIYMKNMIQRSWNSRKTVIISPEEKDAVKPALINALITNYENNHIRPHITESIGAILKWNDDWVFTNQVVELLQSGKQEYIYPGLLLIFEVCINHRWDMYGNRQYIDAFIDSVFPVMEQIAGQLVNQESHKSNEMLYLILKSFKYGCLNNFPSYFTNIDKLNSWIQLHLFLCSKPMPSETMALDLADRSLDKRVKVNKWAFGNLYKFIAKYSRTTKAINQEMVDYVFQNIVPTILQEYFKVIELWGANKGTLWLSESALHYLIQFLEKCAIENTLWSMIQPHFESIINHVIFPCLCASDASVELFEEDPEEYTRRYFDINKESSTADVAATDFIFVIGHKRMEEVNKLLPLINQVFLQYQQNDVIQAAYQEEGALRMLSTLSSFLTSETDNAINLESIFSHFVLPLLSDKKHSFLVARALETISIYQSPFSDMGILSQIFESVYGNFVQNNSLPIQIVSADALKTLVISNPDIHSHIKSQAPQIMERLLKLSKEFEIDTLTEVMEAFVERFAEELTPFANDLAQNLVDQFMQLGQSLIQNSNSNSISDQDQEFQASGMLQTMTTMAMSMNKVCLVSKFLPVVKFVIVNAQIIFLTEIVDLMDSLALSSKSLFNEFTPEVWEMIHDVLDSFQTYALDYFESYKIFFETVINFGFVQDQTYLPAFLSILTEVMGSGVDYDIQCAVELLISYALSLKEIPLFASFCDAAVDEEIGLDDALIVKMLMAGLYCKPLETLQICESKGLLLGLLNKWISSNPRTVFSIKLQMFGIMSMFQLPELPSCVTGFMKPLANKLVKLAQELPDAMSRRTKIGNGEFDAEDDNDNEGLDFYDEIDDDFNDSPLDDIDPFSKLHEFFVSLQQYNPERYHIVMQSMDSDSQDALKTILEFVTSSL